MTPKWVWPGSRVEKSTGRVAPRAARLDAARGPGRAGPGRAVLWWAALFKIFATISKEFGQVYNLPWCAALRFPILLIQCNLNTADSKK